MGGAAYDRIVVDRHWLHGELAHYVEQPLWVEPCYLPSVRAISKRKAPRGRTTASWRDRLCSPRSRRRTSCPGLVRRLDAVAATASGQRAGCGREGAPSRTCGRRRARRSTPRLFAPTGRSALRRHFRNAACSDSIVRFAHDRQRRAPRRAASATRVGRLRGRFGKPVVPRRRARAHRRSMQNKAIATTLAPTARGWPR
jgi:hypothetical protein